MKVIKGGVTAAKGFLASAVNCGIKKSKKSDLALLYSVKPCACAGTFTTNKVRSGSVELCEKHLKGGMAQAVIVNSGNANCCVGKEEIIAAERITGLTAAEIGIGKTGVLIASTGIIGKPLPVEKITDKVPFLVKALNRKGSGVFARAIMTTDTAHKEIAVTLDLGGKQIVIGGAVKGSGMICPNMATMLAFFTTDAAIEKSALKAAFKESVSKSFNKISVDGDMSTNDSAIVLANGMVGNKPVKKGSADYAKFLNALKFVSTELARKIVLDGEGATKFVEIIVKGAKHAGQASKVASHVADSNLVKTMIAGGDPNWGRIAASVGSSGAGINKDKLDIYFGKIQVMKAGSGAKASEKALKAVFKNKEISITIDLGSGKASDKVWTCDLTKEYVRINAEYET